MTMFAFHVSMTDTKENGNQHLWLIPHHDTSELRIMAITGNPPFEKEVANVWIKNEDLKKAIKTLEDLT